jgi:hypothetical protein
MVEVYSDEAADESVARGETGDCGFGLDDLRLNSASLALGNENKLLLMGC